MTSTDTLRTSNSSLGESTLDRVCTRLGLPVNDHELAAVTTLAVSASSGDQDRDLRTYHTCLQLTDDAGPLEEVASAVVVEFEADLPEELDEVFAIADDHCADLCTAVARLSSIPRAMPELYTRLLILDEVTVTPGFRGVGAGELVAGHAVAAAGALHEGTLTVGYPGSRDVDEARRDQVTASAARILTRVGLTPFQVPGGEVLYVGDAYYRHFDGTLRGLLYSSR